MASLAKQVKNLYSKGFKDAKGIKSELDRQEPSKEHSINSIRSYLSSIREPQEEDNSTDISNGTDASSAESVSNDTSNPEENQEVATPAQDIQKAPASIEKPTGKLITGAPFKIEGGSMTVQSEADEISQNYKDTQSQQSIADPNKVVHLDRIGEVSGKLTKMVFDLKPVRKVTHNYKIEEKDSKRLDEDLSMVLKTRLPAVVVEEADLINLGIDFVLVGVKAVFNRFTTPIPSEFLEEINNAEKNVKETVKPIIEGIQQTVEQSRQKEVIPEPNGFPMCENCRQFKEDTKKNEEFNKMLCGTCDYELNLSKASEENTS